MSDIVSLPAEPRTATGKGPNRRLRDTGKVPAVIYGGADAPEMCAVLMKELRKQLQTNANFFSSVVELDFGDRKMRVVPRECQLHPVVDEARPLHIDFIRATKGSKITVQVPVLFSNEERCPGLKRGGVLNVVRREIELVCPIDAIPDQIEADLSTCDIGDSLHISAMTLPADVELTITDRDFTVATITGKGGKDTGEDGVAETSEAEQV
jgi:large subunit ribosomal protein L25